MIYVDEKPVIIVCDNTCYIKIHPVINELMQDAERGTPYDGAKEHYILDIDHGDFATKVVRTLAGALPYPKARMKKTT